MSKLKRARKCIGKTYKGRYGWDEGTIIDVIKVDISTYLKAAKIPFNEYDPDKANRIIREWMSQYNFDSIRPNINLNKTKRIFFLIKGFRPSTDGLIHNHAVEITVRFENMIE